MNNDYNANMKVLLQAEGEDLQAIREQVASKANPLLFSRVASPPKSLPRSRRDTYIKKNGTSAWQKALRSGKEKPGTLSEWKEVHWGGKMKGRAALEEASTKLVWNFECEGYPFPIVDILAQQHKNTTFLLLTIQGGVLRADLWQDGEHTRHINPQSSWQEIAALNDELRLDDLLQCKLRTSGVVVRGSEADLHEGKEILLRTANDQYLSLQRESFRYPLQGDMLLREDVYLRDVLLPEVDGLRLFLDLQW